VKRALMTVVMLLLLMKPLASEPTPPTLTEAQALKIKLLVSQLENAQLRAQAAQRDFDAARDELMKLTQSVAVPGYDFDVSTLTYKPTPKPRP
jgi:hypothetical protein